MTKCSNLFKFRNRPVDFFVEILRSLALTSDLRRSTETGETSRLLYHHTDF
jgi:hypothetical protein